MRAVPWGFSSTDFFIMKWSLFTSLIAFVNHSYAGCPFRIVGGNYVTIEQVPYQAQAIAEDDTACGAAIISEYWLISAAHCFVGSGVDTLSISTGSTESFSGERHEIERYLVHPDYSPYNPHHHDIALIKVKSRIEFKENQYPVTIASEPPKVGDIMRISGYGWESLRKKRGLRRQLKLAEVEVVDWDTCAERYREIYSFITENSFCAGVNGTGSCSRDSGGPGVIDGRLAGLVSGGYECNTEYYPGIYTRVDLYREWIADVTGLEV